MQPTDLTCTILPRALELIREVNAKDTETLEEIVRRTSFSCDVCGDRIVGDVESGSPCAREDENEPGGICRGRYMPQPAAKRQVQ